MSPSNDSFGTLSDSSRSISDDSILDRLTNRTGSVGLRNQWCQDCNKHTESKYCETNASKVVCDKCGCSRPGSEIGSDRLRGYESSEEHSSVGLPVDFDTDEADSEQSDDSDELGGRDSATANKNRLWIVYDGKTHDISDYIDGHPGGRTILETFAGWDITELFDEVHHSEGAKSIMEKLPAVKSRKFISVRLYPINTQIDPTEKFGSRAHSVRFPTKEYLTIRERLLGKVKTDWDDKDDHADDHADDHTGYHRDCDAADLWEKDLRWFTTEYLRANGFTVKPKILKLFYNGVLCTDLEQTLWTVAQSRRAPIKLYVYAKVF